MEHAFFALLGSTLFWQGIKENFQIIIVIFSSFLLFSTGSNAHVFAGLCDVEVVGGAMELKISQAGVTLSWLGSNGELSQAGVTLSWLGNAFELS